MENDLQLAKTALVLADSRSHSDALSLAILSCCALKHSE
jgi:hypothetical protein